ncbi:MAG: HAD-IIA family hydrolase [Armatimonadota bacterium]
MLHGQTLETTSMAYRLVIFDLDGVIYRGDEPMPHAAETVQRLRREGKMARFLTNNSALTREAYVRRLAAMGIPSEEEDFMTSAYATALYLQSQGAEGKRVFIVGEEGIHEELRRIGMRVVTDPEEEGADYVVAGIDRDFTYDKLRRAHYAVQHGAQFVATNRDATYPAAGGRIVPGGGAIVAAIQTCTGVEPLVIGKPNTYSMELLLRRCGVSAGEAVLVGDRLDTDVLVGKRVGLHTVLVLTGVTNEEDLSHVPVEMLPERVIRTLAEL